MYNTSRFETQVFGLLAHLVELSAHNRVVGGSSPPEPTMVTIGVWRRLGACQHGALKVAGSSPVTPTKKPSSWKRVFYCISLFLTTTLKGFPGVSKSIKTIWSFVFFLSFNNLFCISSFQWVFKVSSCFLTIRSKKTQ
ncbi:MAG: hypothetical protein PWQ84_528 [Thermotogaceae bacterium]|nr:hypothetical protein [Thermotogaceae bacterium]